MNYKQMLIDAGLDKKYPIEGISDEQIAEIEKLNQVTLPLAYRDFLKQCGKSAGLYETDSYTFYPYIKSLKEDLEEMILEENINFTITENIFVFSEYQGFWFQYFVCDGNDDPEVYEINDDGEGARLDTPSFTEFMVKSISEEGVSHAATVKNLSET